MSQRIIPAAVAVLLIGCSGGGDSVLAQQLETDEQRTLYALGIALGSNVETFNLTDAELDFVVTGVRDGALGAAPRVDMNVFGPRIQQLASERASAGASAEKAASAAFAAEIAQEPGAEVFESGLVVVPMVEGTGEYPSATDTVRVHYHGTLRDGTVFDSSVERDQTISFGLDQVIPCWTEGVQKIRVGGKAKLVCPSDLAYGDRGTPGIPAGATLLFEVELFGIE